jgi:creatinine amidohydrolase/Fe(II)-dependent formamide hydrolase-like protein
MLGELTSPEVLQRVKAASTLCLPLGAIEQHGPHLPLNTDLVVAEGLTQRLVARWGEEFDLWQLPAFTLGLSREHDWAPGTLSLSIQTFAGLLRETIRELARALPARNLLIINGHGGNRGILENLLHEFAGDFQLNACVIHPFDLAQVATSPEHPDVHGGKAETSVMLVLAPELVRREQIVRAGQPVDEAALRTLVFGRGATFPWRSDDPRLGTGGIIGDAQAATAEFGDTIIAEFVEEARHVLSRLMENQDFMPRAMRPPVG